MISFGSVLAIVADVIYLSVLIATGPALFDAEYYIGQETSEFSMLLTLALIPTVLTAMSVINRLIPDVLRKILALRLSLIGYVVGAAAGLLLLSWGGGGVIIAWPATIIFLVLAIPALLLAYRSYTKPSMRWRSIVIRIVIAAAAIAILLGLQGYIEDAIL